MVMDEDSSVGNLCTDFFRCHAAEHVSWCSTCNRTKKLLNPADISFSLHEASGYFQFYTLFLYRLRNKTLTVANLQLISSLDRHHLTYVPVTCGILIVSYTNPFSSSANSVGQNPLVTTIAIQLFV